jgi:hypothetical protein
MHSFRDADAGMVETAQIDQLCLEELWAEESG